MLMEVHHVGALGGDAFLRGRAVMAYVNDIQVLFEHPVQCLDSAIIIKIEKVVVGHGSAFTDVCALQRPLGGKQNHDHAVGMAWRHPFQAYRLSAERNGHMLVEDVVRESRRNALADDRFKAR